MTPADWVQAGGIGVAMAALVYVVRSMRGLHESVITFFGNHLSKTTEALGQVERGLDKVVDRLERIEERQAMEDRLNRVESKVEDQT